MEPFDKMSIPTRVLIDKEEIEHDEETTLELIAVYDTDKVNLNFKQDVIVIDYRNLRYLFKEMK